MLRFFMSVLCLPPMFKANFYFLAALFVILIKIITFQRTGVSLCVSTVYVQVKKINLKKLLIN
jgi:hypothetical protein